MRHPAVRDAYFRDPAPGNLMSTMRHDVVTTAQVRRAS
jgi:hypothetical protein